MSLGLKDVLIERHCFGPIDDRAVWSDIVRTSDHTVRRSTWTLEQYRSDVVVVSSATEHQLVSIFCQDVVTYGEEDKLV